MIDRRTILAGLLAAPVAVPAAVAGALKAAPVTASWSNFALGPIEELWVNLPQPEGVFDEYHMMPGAEPLRVWVNGTEDPAFAANLARGTVRLAPPAVVRPLVEIDAKGADEQVEFTVYFAQAEGHSPDILDEDAATYCAVA